ncbi:MAG: MBL fold metallo-hydrolase [Acidobacteria bacterium]|nr:MBL fold metallo-hydrolase [Acidobacteriota bacterium]
MTRAPFRTAAALVGVLVAFAGLSAQPAGRFRVTLLGTGSPPPKIDQFGPATLVEAGSTTLLFDTGRGTIQRLTQLGKRYADVNAVFLTHLHSDHVVGLPDFWLTGWLFTGIAALTQAGAPQPRALSLFGPMGTESLAAHLEQAFAFDVGMRISDDRIGRDGGRIAVTELREEGVVYDEGGVRVTLFDVDHRPIVPAFGYRIDYAGRSVALSGDTRFSENLIKRASGVDLLVHEVAVRTGETQETSRMLAHHTLPDQAGIVFTRTAPKLAVYSHVDMSPDVTHERLIEMTRQTYKGPLVVGVDLMSFDVGETITVHEPPAR